MDEGYKRKSLKKNCVSPKESPKTVNQELKEVDNRTPPTGKRDVTPNGGRRGSRALRKVDNVNTPEEIINAAHPGQGSSDMATTSDSLETSTPTSAKRSKKSKNRSDVSLQESGIIIDIANASVLEIPSNAVALRAIYGRSSALVASCPARTMSSKKMTGSSKKSTQESDIQVTSESDCELSAPVISNDFTPNTGRGGKGRKSASSRKFINKVTGKLEKKLVTGQKRLWSDVVSGGGAKVDAKVEGGGWKVSDVKKPAKKRRVAAKSTSEVINIL